MLEIEWDDSFSVHNAEIDNQHKKWIEIYNKMHTTLINGDQKRINTIAADSLNEMQDYARYHFSFEEKYMLEINYPSLIEHRRKHKDFDNLLYSYNRDIREGRLVLNSEIIKLIKNWLLDHILKEDKKYSIFVGVEN